MAMDGKKICPRNMSRQVLFNGFCAYLIVINAQFFAIPWTTVILILIFEQSGTFI